MRAMIVVAALAVLGVSQPALAKTYKVEPGPDATALLRGAFLQAGPGDTIRLKAGRYDINDTLTLAKDEVEVRGEGDQKTILSFTGQTAGEQGLLITSDRVVLRDFAIHNAPRDAIRTNGADEIILRNLHIEWGGEVKPHNGGYGLQVTDSGNILIERVYVRGASLAGIGVTRAKNVVIRQNEVVENTIGYALQNAIGADVYDNVARANAVGAAVFGVPGGQQTSAIRVFKNDIGGGRTPNFAPQSTFIAGLPAGLGIFVGAARNVHLTQNQIHDSPSAHVFLAAFDRTISDPNFSGLPNDVSIRANTFANGGLAPMGDIKTLKDSANLRATDILWDGATSYAIAGRLPRTEPVRIAIVDNRKRDGAVVFTSLNIASAGIPLSEASPTSEAPPVIEIPEPKPIELPQN